LAAAVLTMHTLARSHLTGALQVQINRESQPRISTPPTTGNCHAMGNMGKPNIWKLNNCISVRLQEKGGFVVWCLIRVPGLFIIVIARVTEQ
jgi:hypothetical protein